jgi:hypothetical protein
MTNQQIIDYIKGSLKEGLGKEVVKNNLITNGWPIQDVDEAFQSLEPTSILPPKKRKWLKIILIIIGVIILLGAIIYCLPAILSLFSKDITPIDDSDLQLQTISIPESDNAYYDVSNGSKLDGAIYLSEDENSLVYDHLFGRKWDDKFVKDILSKNATALVYFTLSDSKPKFQAPEFADPDKISYEKPPVPYISLRAASRLNALSALYLAKYGYYKEGLDLAFNSIELGQKMEKSQEPLLNYLTAIGIKNLGMETVQKILNYSIPSNTLFQYSKQFDGFNKNVKGLKSAFKMEYLVESKLIDLIHNGNQDAINSFGSDKISQTDLQNKAKNNFYFQPNNTKELFADWARLNINNVDKRCGYLDKFELKNPIVANASSSIPWSVVKSYFTENAVGKLVSEIIIIDLTGANYRRCENELLISATKLMFAIKTYKINEGKLPNFLADLIPKYITEIPMDPYSGGQLKYSADKKIIYSVGRDLIDLGGSEGDDWRQMQNPMFKIDF